MFCGGAIVGAAVAVAADTGVSSDEEACPGRADARGRVGTLQNLAGAGQSPLVAAQARTDEPGVSALILLAGQAGPAVLRGTPVRLRGGGDRCPGRQRPVELPQVVAQVDHDPVTARGQACACGRL